MKMYPQQRVKPYRDPLLKTANVLSTQRIFLRLTPFMVMKIKARAAELNKSISMFVKDLIYKDILKEQMKLNYVPSWATRKKRRDELFSQVSAELDALPGDNGLKIIFKDGFIYTNSDVVYDARDKMVFIK